MIDFSQIQKFCIACGYTDLRKQIGGLAAIVPLQFQHTHSFLGMMCENKSTFLGLYILRLSLAISKFPWRHSIFLPKRLPKIPAVRESYLIGNNIHGHTSLQQ